MGVIALIIWAVVSFRSLPIDAVPDITNNQVQVLTTSTSLAAEDVERLITTPIEQALASIPGQHELRSISRFGLSVVTLVFDDNVDSYWARAQVAQRLADVGSSLPAGSSPPALAPITTGLGEIFQYTLHVDSTHQQHYSLTELRTLQDWTIRRRLLGTPGVADVSSFGGFVRRIAIRVDPIRMAAFNITTDDVVTAVETANGNAGSSFIEHQGRSTFIRTEGLVHSLSDLERVVLPSQGALLPLRIGDVASVVEDHAIRNGALVVDGQGEAVGGIVMMLKGANSSQVIEAVKNRVKEVSAELPPGISIRPFLDRTILVDKAISTVQTNLIEGALIVIFVLVLLLGNLRAGLIVASVIPLAMLFAIGMMAAFGVSGNLMSLGAIDFGLIVDGAVIIVENVLHHLGTLRGAEAEESISRSASMIRRSAAFGEVIILIVYLPILALSGIEGKMFAPMALTVMFAIIGAFILSTTYVPMMSALLLRRGVRQGNTVADRVMAAVATIYAPVRRAALRHQAFTMSTALLALVIAVYGFLNMGGEFLPQLDEGDFAVETRLPTGSSLQATIDVTSEASRLLTRAFPEVTKVVSKIGTSEIPLDPMPMEAADMIVVLRDKREWTTATSREELATAMERALAVLPGVSFGFQQPIQMRFNELMTGSRQDVVVKLYGDDMDSLAYHAHRLGTILETIEGAEDVTVEPIGGLPQVVVRIDRDAASRFGVTVDAINAAVTAANAGISVGNLVEDSRRFDIVVRFDTSVRTSLHDIGSIPVATNRGITVPLSQVALVEEQVGPNQIQHDMTRRRITVGFNVRGRDVQSIVDDVRRAMIQHMHLPIGYTTHIGGQFENLQAAKQRLAIAVPAALLLILLLLYFTVKSVGEAVMIFVAIPLAAIGGVAALVLRGMPFSISAGIGFIALFGVAVLNGIVLVAAFRALSEQGIHDTLRIVVKGTTQRLRPVTMTALVASLGFLPMALSSGDGAEVQRPLATVVIGGLVSSTMLTLLVLPILYLFVHGKTKLLNRTTGVTSVMFIGMIAMSVYDVNAQTYVSVEQAVNMAMQTHPEAISARSTVVELEALERTWLDPGKTSVTLLAGEYNTANFDNNITIQQTIPFPSVWFAERRLARTRTHEASAMAAATSRLISVRVRQTYQRIIALRAMLAIEDQHDRLLQDAMLAAQKRLREGDASNLDVRAIEADRAMLRLDIVQHQSQLRHQESTLAALCGSPAALTADTGALVPMDNVEPLPSDQWLPRIRSAVNVTNEQLDVERNRLLPDITLGWFSQTLIGPQVLGGTERSFTSADRFSGFSIGLHVPLWLPANTARIDRAEAAALAAKHVERASTQMLEHQLGGHRARCESARRAVELHRTNVVPLASSVVEASYSEWQQGNVGVVAYQTAMSRLLKAKLDEARSVLELNLLILETPIITDL